MNRVAPKTFGCLGNFAPKALGFLWAAALGVAAFVLVAFPLRAWADTNYTIDELSTELRVNPDGSIHVTTRQILTIDGDNRGFTWYLYEPGDWESVRIDSIVVAPVDDGGVPLGGWTRLQKIDVSAEKQGQWPGDSADITLRSNKIQPWYSYDLATGMVRSYFPAANGSYMIETSYSITNVVYVYRDIAELNWRYAHGSMPVDQKAVSLQVVLPVPEGAAVVPGDNVMAWGHGPHDGRFEVTPEGTVIYQIDFLESGSYGEAHVIWPASWMTAMGEHAPYVFTEIHKPIVLSEESEWVDASQREARWDNSVRLLCFAGAAIILLVGIICVLRFGMTVRSRRVLIRVSAILAIESLAALLFFQEPYTVVGLGALAIAVALASLFMPQHSKEELEISADREDALEFQKDEPQESPYLLKEDSHDDQE